MAKAQAELAGFEREVNKKVENVMQILADKKKAKTRANNAHKEAEQRVIDVMRDEHLSEYTSQDLGLTVTVDDIEKVGLKTWTPPKPAKPEAEA